MKYYLTALVLLLSASGAAAQWSYRSLNDQMRGTKTKFAELSSINRAQLDFPYQGGSKLKLLIQKKGDSAADVVFWIDRGQLPCYSNCKLSAKFDEEEVTQWELTGSASGRSDGLFVDEADQFLEKLRGAKTLIVEVLVFNHGNLQFTFNTKGLKWE